MIAVAQGGERGGRGPGGLRGSRVHSPRRGHPGGGATEMIPGSAARLPRETARRAAAGDDLLAGCVRHLADRGARLADHG